MPANLVILDKDGHEIDIYQGLDFGLTRKGISNFKEIRIKNTGNVVAKDVILTAVPMSAPTDVTSDEYENQVKATKWKSFGYEEDGVFSPYLNVGNIKYVTPEYTPLYLKQLMLNLIKFLMILILRVGI